MSEGSASASFAALPNELLLTSFSNAHDLSRRGSCSPGLTDRPFEVVV